MSDAIFRLLLALILTILIEIGVAFLFRFKNKDQIKIIVWMNILSNPAMNVVLIILSLFIFLGHNTYGILLAILEPIVIYTEYCILKYVFGKEYSKKQLFIITLCMNTASFLIGFFIFNTLLI